MNKEELIRLHVAYIDFLEENDVRTISTSEEAGEDSRGCDCCGTRLFGPRHTMTTGKDYDDWLFCAECQQIAIFGEIDDLTLMDISVDDYEDAVDTIDEYARLASKRKGADRV